MLAARVFLFALSGRMGTSLAMIEGSYRTPKAVPMPEIPCSATECG
jgi:hypothetical protein